MPHQNQIEPGVPQRAAKNAARNIAVIGAGPAGLMAADVLSDPAGMGANVTIYDRMPSPGRKFLMAGRGGLNLTHTEGADAFLSRYGASREWLEPAIADFEPADLRFFASELGQETFVGTSGRVFPKSFKTSPLLRAWLARLGQRGVTLQTRETLCGFENGKPMMTGPDGARRAISADAVILALGGGSWPKLGSDGQWTRMLESLGVAVEPLAASNCGALVKWSERFANEFEGQALKRMAFAVGPVWSRGEAVVTRMGLEGGAVYALSGLLRDALASGDAKLRIDLAPHLSLGEATAKLKQGRAGDSRSNALRKRLALPPIALALLRESEGGPLPTDPPSLAARVKNVVISVAGLSGLERAISSAGGVKQEAFDGNFMLRAVPGIFVAGEMLDFDAPTGGYLLQAAFATGHAAAKGAERWLGFAEL